MDSIACTKEEIAIIKAVQEEFPLVVEPYQQLAKQLAMNEEKLLCKLTELQQRGLLKRISIALKHNNIGYVINAMLVWRVPEEKVEELGRRLAGNSQVTHCYERNVTEEFSYNLYAMVHTTSEVAYEKLVRELVAVMGDYAFVALRTKRELKKIGMKYFLSTARVEHESSEN